MAFRFASPREKFFFFLTAFAIFIYGATRPLFSLMFGQVTGNVNDAAHSKSENTWEGPVRMIIVGAVAGFFRCIQITGLEIFAWKMSHKIKIEYFKAILGKDSEWFDSHNPNELASKIVKESQMIYRGIGEKMGDLYGVGSIMSVALSIGFTISWECTLIVMGGFPVVMISMVIAIKAGQAGIKDGLIAYQ